jgi:hypothetical protein
VSFRSYASVIVTAQTALRGASTCSGRRGVDLLVDAGLTSVASRALGELIGRHGVDRRRLSSSGRHGVDLSVSPVLTRAPRAAPRVVLVDTALTYRSARCGPEALRGAATCSGRHGVDLSVSTVWTCSVRGASTWSGRHGVDLSVGTAWTGGGSRVLVDTAWTYRSVRCGPEALRGASTCSGRRGVDLSVSTAWT